MKEKFDYIYDNYGRTILWSLLALQAIIIAMKTY